MNARWTKIVVLVPGDREDTTELFDAIASLAHTHSEARNDDFYLDSVSGTYLELVGP